MRRWLWLNGLALVSFGAFAIFLVGQSLVGWHAYNGDLQHLGTPALSFLAYLGSGHFVEATPENWESEFLQMGAYVVLTAMLVQRGSPESNPPDQPKDDDPSDPKQIKADSENGSSKDRAQTFRKPALQPKGGLFGPVQAVASVHRLEEVVLLRAVEQSPDRQCGRGQRRDVHRHAAPLPRRSAAEGALCAVAHPDSSDHSRKPARSAPAGLVPGPDGIRRPANLRPCRADAARQPFRPRAW
jgi:hypothetical protein